MEKGFGKSFPALGGAGQVAEPHFGFFSQLEKGLDVLAFPPSGSTKFWFKFSFKFWSKF